MGISTGRSSRDAEIKWLANYFLDRDDSYRFCVALARECDICLSTLIVGACIWSLVSLAGGTSRSETRKRGKSPGKKDEKMPKRVAKEVKRTISQ